MKGYSAHGLRKAGATGLAEAGGSDHEIMAWGGWKTLKKFQKYMERARRKRLPFEVESVSGKTAAEEGSFSEEQIIGILREHEAESSTADILADGAFRGPRRRFRRCPSA